MMDAVAAAAAVVSLLAPAATEMTKGAAAHLGELADDKLLPWLRQKLNGPARQALTDLETKPASPGRQATLREELETLLQQNPTLLAELSALLPAQSATYDIMALKVEGPGATGIQIKGDANTVTTR